MQNWVWFRVMLWDFWVSVVFILCIIFYVVCFVIVMLMIDSPVFGYCALYIMAVLLHLRQCLYTVLIWTRFWASVLRCVTEISFKSFFQNEIKNKLYSLFIFSPIPEFSGALSFGSDLFRRRVGEQGGISCVVMALERHCGEPLLCCVVILCFCHVVLCYVMLFVLC